MAKNVHSEIKLSCTYPSGNLYQASKYIRLLEICRMKFILSKFVPVQEIYTPQIYTRTGNLYPEICTPPGNLYTKNEISQVVRTLTPILCTQELDLPLLVTEPSDPNKKTCFSQQHTKDSCGMSNSTDILRRFYLLLQCSSLSVVHRLSQILPRAHLPGRTTPRHARRVIYRGRATR